MYTESSANGRGGDIMMKVRSALRLNQCLKSLKFARATLDLEWT